MQASTAPRGLSIRVKTVLLGFGYLLALFAVYGAFTVHLLRREVSQATARLEQTARIVATEVDGALASGVQRLETVSRLPGLAFGLQAIQEARGAKDSPIPPWTTLHYLFFRTPLFTGGVFLLDRTGTVLWTEPPGQPWLRQVLIDVPPIAAAYAERRREISGVLPSGRLSSHPHVVVAVPIQNEDGEPQGALAGVIELSANEFRDMLQAVRTTDGRIIEVLDQSGIVLAGTDPPRLFHRADGPPAKADALLRASVPLSTTGWRIVAEQPRSLGLGEIWRSQGALWVIGFILLLLAVALGAPILNDFVQATRQLTDAAETVARGDLSRPLAMPARHDEFATLGRAFEQMRVELAGSRRSLEQRLQEREDLLSRMTLSNRDLREAQARLIESERLAAIGELSAAVAHGIRNPVAGIKAAAQFASLDLPPDHPLTESINDIITEADKLDVRITTLLNFARPFEPTFAPAGIDRIVEAAATSLHRHMEAHGIELRVDLSPSLPEVDLDEAQVEQVLLELLSNAVEATPAGGRVSIQGGLTEDGERVRLTVADTGSGIPRDQLERVFKLFFTTKPSGTGFGLAVAKRIVERHGGTIEVESTLGQGTVFTIELPLSQSARRDKRGASQETNDEKNSPGP